MLHFGVEGNAVLFLDCADDFVFQADYFVRGGVAAGVYDYQRLVLVHLGAAEALALEAAWIASRKDPVLSAAYVEYCRSMKPSKAIIKIARRLVNRIYFVMKHQQPYVNCYVS